MRRIILCLIIALTGLAIALNAQEGSFPRSNTRDIIRRLSAENFRNMRILYPAIMNYGDGEEQFDNLILTYSEASSLYFSREFEKAAKMFQENEKQIREIATDLARRYKEDTESFQENMIGSDIMARIISDVHGDDYNLSKEKLISQSTASIVQANDYFDRVRPLQAIEYYRVSRDRMLQYLYIEAEELPDEIIEECREDMYMYDSCINQAKAERRAEVDEQYEKWISDNKQQVHTLREKEN